MVKMKAPEDVVTEKRLIRAGKRGIPILILRPKEKKANVPGVLWLHGGGYATGMKEMVYGGRAANLASRFGATVVSPDYRLSVFAPYPAAVEDCYAVLLYMKEHAEELGFRSEQLMVGGESAGGGLCAAICMMARDRGDVKLAYQMPLYPMIDNFDTETSADNHGKVWNTRRNHMAWRLYLRKDAKLEVSPYAAPARQKDYSRLPPAYTFVGTAEPFYAETVRFIDALKAAGVEASMDVYEGMYHAFDMMEPELEISKLAAERFERQFEYAMEHYYTEP